MSRILLIHSEPEHAELICETVASNNATSFVVAGSVSTLSQGFEFLRHRVPDAIVVDLRVSDGPPAFWFDQLRAGRRLLPRLIVLARSPHDPELLDALRRGVDGYALTSDAPETLLSVIAEVLGGRSTMSPEIARRLQAHFARPRGGGASPINERDRQLLQWFSTGYGLDEIAQGMHTTPLMIGVQVRGLFRKLQSNPPGPAPKPRLAR